MKPTSSRKDLRVLLEGVTERVVLDTSCEGERSLAIRILEERGYSEQAASKATDRSYSKVNGTRLIWWERSEG